MHSGPVYICTVEAGQGMFRDMSIFGHTVNVTARLASEAPAGQALATDAVAGHLDAEFAARKLKNIDAPVMATTI